MGVSVAESLSLGRMQKEVVARSWVPGQGLPDVLVSLLAPKLLEPLLALAADPAASEVHEQITVAVAHIVAALDVCVEFALRIDADVVPDELVLQH